MGEVVQKRKTTRRENREKNKKEVGGKKPGIHISNTFQLASEPLLTHQKLLLLLGQTFHDLSSFFPSFALRRKQKEKETEKKIMSFICIPHITKLLIWLSHTTPKDNGDEFDSHNGTFFFTQNKRKNADPNRAISYDTKS